ncbi:MAG: PilZ domain-containing protein [Desulfobacterales bacterium]|nr:MAG: PilZ domain-containing protein [Desulfobacterales bacterium]
MKKLIEGLGRFYPGNSNTTEKELPIEAPVEEQRQYQRFPAKLSITLEAMATNRFRVLNAETKDISSTGTFIFTKEAAFIPDDTQFTLNSSNSEESRIEQKELKQLENCIGTMVRSTSEGIAIRFNRPVDLIV